MAISKLIWQKKLTTTIFASVLAAGNKVVTSDGEAIALDMSTGNQLWMTNVNSTRIFNPADLVIVNKDGNSYYMVESGMK